MPLAPVLIGSAIALMLMLLAALFGARQLTDRERRAKDLPRADAEYFEGQDVRRLIGSVVMFLIAAGMLYGLWMNPRAGRAEFRTWGLIWLGVSVLVCFLIVLAMFDWLAIRVYARRHRQILLDERLRILESERRRLGLANREIPRTAENSDGRDAGDPSSG
jgi:hypothetical protein